MMAMNEDRHEVRAVGVKTVILAGLLGLVVLLAIGGIAGAAAAWIESPENWGEATLAIAGAVAIGAFATLGLLRLKPWGRTDEPISPKTRKSRNMLMLSVLLGVILGAALSLSTISMDDPFAMFSNGPLPAAVVIPTLAVLLLAVPVISWQWHRNVDEHEAEAYKFGGLAAVYLYGYLAPAWWLAARGGLVPAPDVMVIYLIVLSVWLVGWFWRRYR